MCCNSTKLEQFERKCKDKQFGLIDWPNFKELPLSKNGTQNANFNDNGEQLNRDTPKYLYLHVFSFSTSINLKMSIEKITNLLISSRIAFKHS